MINSKFVIFDFNKDKNLQNWQVVNDRVMGGRSQSHLKINENGHGEFCGDVSLAHNGGFSSIQLQVDEKEVQQFSNIVLKVKGDGKPYQFRIKANSSDRHSYVKDFRTTTDLETIKIPFKEFSPAFRGRNLDIPNYDGKKMQEIAILIGNKKSQSFKLEIDYIGME